MAKIESFRTDLTAGSGARIQRIIIPSRNLLIAALPQHVMTELMSVAQGVHLKGRQIVYEAGDEIEFTYFPIDCVVSSLALLEDGSTVEIAMTGREGLVGIPALIGGGRAMHWTRVSISGNALKISKQSLEAQANKHAELHSAIMKSYRDLFRQICQRAVCNIRHTLLQRLAVWLLMTHDRIGRNELTLTQEEIAGRISVRRAGVSVATSMLQNMQAITTRRGRIVILDRAILENAACECYEVLRNDFDARTPPGDQAPRGGRA